MNSQLKLIINLVLVGFAVLFIIQNAAVVEIKFMFWTLSMSRALFMFFMLAIGIITGWTMKSIYVHRKAQSK